MKNVIQNVRLWMNKNRELLLIIGGMSVLLLAAYPQEAITEFSKGVYDGLTEKNNKEELSIASIIGYTLVTLFLFLLLFGFLISILGNIFYYVFFKQILKKSTTLNIIAFILWLLIVYNLFWGGVNWIFIKTNAFSKRDFTLNDYRDNYTTLLTALSFVFIIVYSLVKNYIANSKTQATLIAQKSQAELMALKAQINPHFLFNVLNNLYGSAIVEDSPKTSEGILQLSSIMRHVVEGTKNERIEVEKEVRFLNDYIELNKMRIPNRPNIRIVTEIFWDENPTMIAPLLVIPYLENAFKYGISTTEECFIEMSFRIENQQLSFVCKNSIIKTNDKLEVGTGTGLDNTKRRLDLYYPTAYQLSTSSSDNVFEVNLGVKL